MKYDRNQILAKFLESESLVRDLNSEEIDPKEVSYSAESENLEVEALKKLIFSYCKEDAPATVIRNTMLLITQKTGGEDDNR